MQIDKTEANKAILIDWYIHLHLHNGIWQFHNDGCLSYLILSFL